MLLDPIKEIEDGQPKCVGNHLDGVQSRVRSAVLDAAQIGLVEAAALAELHLAQPGLDAELAHADAKYLRKRGVHGRDSLGYALNHINTNSYIRVAREAYEVGDLKVKAEARELATRVWERTTDAERAALVDWLRALATIRDSGGSVPRKAYIALRCTLTSKAVWPLVKQLSLELKRLGWDERSSKWRAFLGGSAAGLLLLGTQGAGIAALGGAIGVPLWLVIGGGAVVLDALIDASKAGRGPRD